MQIFPNLADAYRILLVSKNQAKIVEIGERRLAEYDDLEKYRQYKNEKYLWPDTGGTLLMSYKYFHAYRNQLINHYLLFEQSYIDEANGLLKKFAITIDDLKQRYI